VDGAEGVGKARTLEGGDGKRKPKVVCMKGEAPKKKRRGREENEEQASSHNVAVD